MVHPFPMWKPLGDPLPKPPKTLRQPGQSSLLMRPPSPFPTMRSLPPSLPPRLVNARSPEVQRREESHPKMTCAKPPQARRIKERGRLVVVARGRVAKSDLAHPLPSTTPLLQSPDSRPNPPDRNIPILTVMVAFTNTFTWHPQTVGPAPGLPTQAIVVFTFGLTHVGTNLPVLGPK